VKQKRVDEHIGDGKLLEMAETTQWTNAEFSHLEQCRECLAVYARSILQVARSRARAKSKQRLSAGNR